MGLGRCAGQAWGDKEHIEKSQGMYAWLFSMELYFGFYIFFWNSSTDLHLAAH